jgi:hypothetical protein
MALGKYYEDNLEIYIERMKNRECEKEVHPKRRTPKETRIVRK